MDMKPVSRQINWDIPEGMQFPTRKRIKRRSNERTPKAISHILDPRQRQLPKQPIKRKKLTSSQRIWRNFPYNSSMRSWQLCELIGDGDSKYIAPWSDQGHVYFTWIVCITTPPCNWLFHPSGVCDMDNPSAISFPPHYVPKFVRVIIFDVSA